MRAANQVKGSDLVVAQADVDAKLATADFNTAMQNVVTTNYLGQQGFLKQTDLSAYVKTSDLSQYAPMTALQNYALTTLLQGYATTSSLSAHAGNTSNPHSTTKAQVGLGSVDNTSDASKPISTATQAALTTLTASIGNKADLSGSTFTGPVNVSAPAGSDNSSLAVSSAWVRTYVASLGFSSTPGTLTSVGLTVPAGLTVTGSPITTSGTFAIKTTLTGVILGNGTGFSGVSIASITAATAASTITAPTTSTPSPQIVLLANLIGVVPSKDSTDAALATVTTAINAIVAKYNDLEGKFNSVITILKGS